ncbi:hypothetical protein [Hymenobacter algoricola]|uniref:Secreted protein n=1 Tax=Hymenobacter algoricola TaxID=486267 RepID=A0ABP7NA87_9BACT
MKTGILLLLGILLLVLSTAATAARPSACARPKMKGPLYVHRPNYKICRGHPRRHRTWLGRLIPQTHRARPARSRL